ncbi:uncharacterized protein ACBT57_001663 isoform 5-T5 [Dama dama]
MATYPPRRLLGARPLPSDPRRDPRRSDFPPGGGGRWERRLRTGQSWGWVDCFSRVGEGTRRGASPLRFPPRGPHLLSHQLTGRLVATPQPLQPRNLRCLRARFQGQAARHHHFLRRKFKKEQILGPSLPFPSLFPPQFLPASSAFFSTM